VTLELGVLVSGSGSNLQAILDAIDTGRLDARCRLVLSNRPGVFALERARAAGVPSVTVDHKQYPTRQAFEEQVVSELRAQGVEWLALAGFMRVLSPLLLDAYRGRVVNIHPSLLPAFPGVDAQGQAHAYGVKVAGCTVHFVDSGVDSGPIIAQTAVPVFASDSAEDLRLRILEQEHLLFPQALQWIAEGRVHLVAQDGAGSRARVSVDPREPDA
jgi:phosphoribosylglycinamide formyltransferase 1